MLLSHGQWDGWGRSENKNPELRSCGPLSLTTTLIEINEMIDFRIDLQINVQI